MKTGKNESGINEYLENRAEEINKIIHESLTMVSSNRSIEKLLGRSGYHYDPETIKKGILEPSLYLLNSGGKRWRPVLMLLIIDALGKNSENFVEFSLIPEVIHNGTLVHDDIEDNSPMRRNQPALHIKYGIDIATNLGDFMYFFPLVALADSSKLSKESKNQVLTVFVKEMTRLSIGQATDITWHKHLIDPMSISTDNYLQMVFDKTGVLARMAAKIGAVLGGADEDTVEALGKFGATIGVAFQIQDDLLNIYPSSVSKSKGGVGEDITEGKLTMLVIHALQKASKTDAQRLIAILNMHTSDPKLIAEAISIIDRYGSKEYAQKVMENIVSNAWQEIEKMLLPSEAKERLKQLAEFLIRRSI
ncbi:MAG: polyprenyl synthetase family protein [Candidatus Micrarchaeota archaeon]|nr:polyprenyl synthetase family protein [Candidatus Micrarchaeota archaeon]